MSARREAPLPLAVGVVDAYHSPPADHVQKGPLRRRITGRVSSREHSRDAWKRGLGEAAGIEDGVVYRQASRGSRRGRGDGAVSSGDPQTTAWAAGRLRRAGAPLCADLRGLA